MGIKKNTSKGVNLIKQFFSSDYGLIISLLIFFPLGIYLVWKNKSEWKTSSKFIASVVPLIIFYLFVSSNQELATLKTEAEVARHSISEVSKNLEDEQNINLNLKNKLDETELALSELASEHEKYEKKMKPYEKLSEADAKKKIADLKKAEEKRLEEEKQKKEKEKKEKEEREAKLAEERKQRLAEAAEKEARGYETGITFQQLARTPDKYSTEKVKFNGEVLQIMEGDGINAIRLAVGGDYNSVIYCIYDSSIVSTRILEDDWITISGIADGLYSYETTQGNELTIPKVLVKKIDQ
ncbi:hypothetical protein OL233_05160 [Vagococcus sp. PNs007]|uniref:Uncharacterized protein n=1 Tax=Vagococcus proximus TaxID=2991417 RepID=A0ABT5X0Z3_9ENTE|nr:hypothetical protein [Vagococcus proximus]MDF0479672.1 hypothetical protein [Vagococcus proximus]